MHLADGEPAEAEKLSDDQDSLKVPLIGPESGCPHRERPTGCHDAIIDAVTVILNLFADIGCEGRFVGFQIRVKADFSKESVGLDQLWFIGDSFGGAANGDCSREQNLSQSVASMDVAQSVKGVQEITR